MESLDLVGECGEEKERRRWEGLPGYCAAPVLEEEEEEEGRRGKKTEREVSIQSPI